MAEREDLDVAVPTFTAHYNNSTGKIDLNWTAPTDIPEGYKIGGYQLVYRIGAWEYNSNNMPVDEFFEYNGVTLIGSTSGLFYPFIADLFVDTYSFAVYPTFFKTGEALGYNGRIKLLTYSKEEPVAVPLYQANDMTKDLSGNVYIRNGYQTSDTVGALSVISKISNTGEFSNVSANATQTPKGFTYSSASGLTYNVSDDKIYSVEDDRGYTVLDSSGNLISFFNKMWNDPGNVYSLTNYTISDSAGNVYIHFMQHPESVLGGTQYVNFIFKMFPNVSSKYSTHNLKGNVTWVEQQANVGDLYKYKIYTENTFGLKEKQFITIDSLGTNHAIVTEVQTNVSVTFVSKNPFTFNPTGVINKNLYAYPFEVVAGGLYRQNETHTFTDNYFDTNIGYSASKGFIAGNFYCYMRKLNQDSTDTEFIKVNLTSGEITSIGTNTANTYKAVVYSNYDGYAYAITDYALYKKDVLNNTTTFVAGDNVAPLTSGNVDGQGATVRFFKPVAMVAIDNNIIILERKSVSSGDPLYNSNVIRVYNITTNTVGTVNVTQAQPTEVKDEDSGNGDVSGSGVGLSFGGYIADIPPYNSVTPEPVTVRDPENNIIGVIPMPVGLSPDTVVTFRKNGDRLYILVNGKVIWTYRLSPIELYNFNSTLYRGWYTIGTRTPTETPEEAITYPIFDGLFYVFDGQVVEPMASNDILFTYGKNYAGQALIVYNDGTVIVDRVVDNDDIETASYVVRGGRKYKIFNNTYSTSPLLPRWVVDAIVNSGLYDYLKEVEEV